MAEFCTCGSIVINGHCTNKGCSHKAARAAAASATEGSKKKESAEKKAAKPARTRRASKCITYNINELSEKENA